MKVCSVVGARPQFVKAGAVSRAIRRDHRLFEVLIHTGQHYDWEMSEVFFREFDLPPPQHNLEVGSARHGVQTARMLERLESVFLAENPRVVLIYGDTNSTLAGALAAAKLNVPVAHVEAGLRSFNRRMPEEINRIMADSVSDVLFAPTEQAVAQLRKEGCREDKIVWTGDVMYDVALMSAGIAKSKSRIVENNGLREKQYYLATVHRAENTDDAAHLRTICDALAMVSRVCPVVLPLHPRTRAALIRDDLLETLSRTIKVIEPVGYFDMIRLEMGARAVITDSGGVQKEAFFCRVPCFIVREETEWVELVHAGWNRLVPPGDAEQMARIMLDFDVIEPRDIKPYGDGNASSIIVQELVRRYDQ